MGQSPTSDTYNESEGLPFFQGNADFGKLHPNVRIYCNAPIRIADNDDVLISVRAPIGAINIADRKCCIGRGLAAIRGNEKRQSRFIYYLLLASKDKLVAQGTGSTFKSIGKDALYNLSVPSVSLETQSRIVAELDLLQAIIDKQKAQLAELDNLAQCIFYDMFGDPVDNDKGWEVKKLGEVTNKISDGVHAKPNYTETGMPFISVVNINRGKLIFDDCKYVSQTDGETFNKRTKPEKGDILYTKVGATYGISALVDVDVDFCLYVSVCLIKPKRELLDSLFLTHMMRLPYIKNQADERIRGIGVPDLHLNQISAFDVIVPPLSLQQSFAAKIESIEKQKAAISQSIAETQRLFDYTMDKYFG